VGVAKTDFGGEALDARFSYLGPQISRIYLGWVEETVCHGNAQNGFAITEDVPVLRVNHCASQGVLFGVW
jgi:hypothetical protein